MICINCGNSIRDYEGPPSPVLCDNCTTFYGSLHPEIQDQFDAYLHERILELIRIEGVSEAMIKFAVSVNLMLDEAPDFNDGVSSGLENLVYSILWELLASEVLGGNNVK